jgi:hypothetical protein
MNQTTPTGTEAGFDLDSLTRYDIGECYYLGGCSPMEPCKTGDWVKFEDVAALARRAAPATSDMPDTTASAACWMCNDSGIVGFPPDQYESCPDCTPGAAEQHNAVECVSALRAEPASQRDADKRAFFEHWDKTNSEYGYGETHIIAYKAAQAAWNAATRCRAEGGDTNSNSPEFEGISGSDLAAKAPAAQAVTAKEGEMLPCPFCGKETAKEDIEHASDCFFAVSAHHDLSVKLCRAAWNRRAASPASTPEQTDLSDFQAYMRRVHPVTNPYPLDVWIAAQRAARATQQEGE